MAQLVNPHRNKYPGHLLFLVVTHYFRQVFLFELQNKIIPVYLNPNNMSKQSKSIPLNSFPDVYGSGIIIAKATTKDFELEKIKEAHRDDYHLFFILESGGGLFEIDFQQYELKASTVMYIQPFQVHRGLSMKDSIFSLLLISNENISPEYLPLLKEIAPAAPLQINTETFSMVMETITLCIKFQESKHEKLYPLIVKDSCNTLIALIASQYLVQSNQLEKPSRLDNIAKDFKLILEQEFLTTKRPMDYAGKLKISTVYLNECVKKVTGQNVSYHIHQRVILEAKRLLYHSNKSVKEIATELGYEDYPYFSRLFAKVTGMTALAFRNKNLE